MKCHFGGKNVVAIVILSTRFCNNVEVAKPSLQKLYNLQLLHLQTRNNNFLEIAQEFPELPSFFPLRPTHEDDWEFNFLLINDSHYKFTLKRKKLQFSYPVVQIFGISDEAQVNINSVKKFSHKALHLSEAEFPKIHHMLV